MFTVAHDDKLPLCTLYIDVYHRSGIGLAAIGLAGVDLAVERLGTVNVPPTQQKKN